MSGLSAGGSQLFANWWRVNQLFLAKDDWKKIGALVVFMFARGKALSFLSDLSRERLGAFTSPSRSHFIQGLVNYLVCLVLVSPLTVIFNAMLQRLQLVWANTLTHKLTEKMLRSSSQNSKEFETIVSSDCDKFVELQIDLSREILEAVSHLYFFTQILWQYSPLLAKIAVVTAGVTTTASLMANTQRLSLLFRLEKEAQARFSHTLSTVREHLEGIQFENGTEFELQRLSALDSQRLQASLQRKQEKDFISLANQLVRQISSGGVTPYVLRQDTIHDDEGSLHIHPVHGHAHAHDHGHDGKSSDKLSVLVQVTEAFDEMLFHLLLVSENFHNVTRMFAIAQDISFLMDRGSPHDMNNSVLKMEEVVEEDVWLSVKNVSIRVPTSNVLLLDNFNVTLKRGESLLITGNSGCGKTSVLRVLFGLWKAQEGGEVRRPDRLICLAQRPYLLVHASLKAQVSFPKSEHDFTLEQVQLALNAVGLDHLKEDPTRNWQVDLSMGEQQRISFARIVLHEYEFAFLDESTSNLDLDSESKMYRLLQDRQCSFVSVGHRKSIEQFHLKKVHLLGKSGQWKQVY